MSVDFNALLSVESDAVREPQPLPAGHYLCMVDGHKFGQSKQKSTPFVEFSLKVMAPQADVDATQLADIDLNKKAVRHTCYITPDSLYRLKQFYEACDIDVTGRQLNEILPETQGKTVTVKIRHRVDEASGRRYEEVENVLKAA